MLESDLLGVDFAAGAPIRRRATQVKRRQKGKKRRGKLQWWYRNGGAAKRVARAGVLPQMGYGGMVNGLTNPMIRDMRSVVAATTYIKCSGASTSAKMALGGEKYGDVDPLIIHANPPLQAIISRAWDKPASRHQLVRSWMQARDELGSENNGTIWQKIRGPVGAAWAHMQRIGARWVKPFVIEAMDHEINILHVPRSR